jgi:hypothetical protein
MRTAATDEAQRFAELGTVSRTLQTADRFGAALDRKPNEVSLAQAQTSEQ